MGKWSWFKREPPVTEGTLARIKAQQDLAEHKALRPEVDEIAASLRGIRVRNHFSEQLTGLIQGERNP